MSSQQQKSVLSTAFTHGSESIGKFSITYGYYSQTTLLTDITNKSESIRKFNITYQLLPTDLYYLPTITHNLYYLPTLLTDLYYLPIITHRSLLPTNF